MDLFGMPREDFNKILDYEYKLLHVSNTIETRAQAARDIYGYLLELIAEKRANPKDDLASSILEFTVDDRPLTDKEIMGMYCLLFVGGLDTVASSLGFAWRYLATNPAAQQAPLPWTSANQRSSFVFVSTATSMKGAESHCVFGSTFPTSYPRRRNEVIR